MRYYNVSFGKIGKSPLESFRIIEKFGGTPVAQAL